MANQLVRLALKLQQHQRCQFIATSTKERKITMKMKLSERPKDRTLEKMMKKYKHLMRVVVIQDIILGSSAKSVAVEFLERVSHRLHLGRSPLKFLRLFPHVFSVSEDSCLCTLAEAALEAHRRETAAIEGSLPNAVERLLRLLSISLRKKLPLQAIFLVWRDLGLPDDFEDSVIARNPHLFRLSGTQILSLVPLKDDHSQTIPRFTAAVENWRQDELYNKPAPRKRLFMEAEGLCRKNSSRGNGSPSWRVDEIKFGFKHVYPTGMKIDDSYRDKVRRWQRSRYFGPYDEAPPEMRASEKRAVAIAHEFLSLTVEKMIDVEKITHFRKWFGIKMKMRDVFLDHPGMFYLSAKGRTHTIFLREAYVRGRVAHPDPVCAARMRLFELVRIGRRCLTVPAWEPPGLIKSDCIVGEDEK